MGANLGCCHKRTGRTKSEIMEGDAQIEKLTESLKGGSIASSKLSREKSHLQNHNHPFMKQRV